MFNWHLFIDDERHPTNPNRWWIARTSEEAINLITKHGMPVEITFDHDLGGDDTSMRVIHWIIDQHLDGKLPIPDTFAYSIHSQNSVGVRNISGLMDGFLKHIGRQ
jgi:hypothetical protein